MRILMILIRPYQSTDKDFICSSFIKSTYHNSIDASVKLCNQLTWSVGMNQVINHLIQSSTVLVACLEDDTDLILGYLIYYHDRLIYCYVKQAFRQQGISKELVKELPESIKYISFCSKQMNYLTKQLKTWAFNPF